MRPCGSSNAFTFFCTVVTGRFHCSAGSMDRSATTAAMPRQPNRVITATIEVQCQKVADTSFGSHIWSSYSSLCNTHRQSKDSQLYHQRIELTQMTDDIVYDQGSSSIINAYVCLKCTYDAHDQSQQSNP
jgi:hypothetical protein